MEKKPKKIWIVETFNSFVFTDGVVKTNNLCQSYFSTEEKAKVHVEWLKQCAINNGANEVYANVLDAKYKLNNGENFVISTTNTFMDCDDVYGKA